MKLHSIDVDGFGVLTETAITDIGGGLNVVYGSNGSGKTTLLHFLRGVFCGFAQSHQIGLLPPSGGRVGGGSLRVRWDGDVCRFARFDEAGPDDRLRVTLLRNDLETTHPRFDASGLRTDLVPLLYTVSAADVHVVESLVQQAMRDGIQLVGRRENPEQLNAAATHVHSERSRLLRNGDAGQVTELTEQRQRLQSELHRLTEALRQRCGEWESQQPARPTSGISTWRRKVTWLRTELAAAECDHHEAQNRAWMPQPAPRTVTRTVSQAMPSLAHLKPQRREHIDVQRIHRLKQLDRHIDHARTLLAEAARARLDVNLRAARIAGSDDTPAEPFIKQVRESLASLEVGILELSDESQTLSSEHESGRCVCGRWQTASREAVTELSKRLYQLCEHVSRYELKHKKSVFADAVITIGACELTLLRHLEALRSERRAILDSTGELREWKGSVQSKVEHDHCECLEHEPRLGWKLPQLPVKTPAIQTQQVRTQQIVRTIRTVIDRPSSQTLVRLQQRVSQLRGELGSAVLHWREARNWRPTMELPADIRALERRIDDLRIELDSIESSLADSQERWRVLSVTGEVIRRVVEKMERDQPPTVIQWASQYLQRLTGGRYVEVCVTPNEHTIELIAEDGSRRPRSALSRGTLDQLALSLRLALARAYAARGILFPLVLDDVLVDTDHERLQAAVTLLQEFADEQDQQIVYLTCQTHLADMFERHGTPVRTFPGSAPRPQRIIIDRESSAGALHGWVDRKASDEVKPAEPISVERPQPQPVDTAARVVDTESHSQESGDSREGESQSVRILKPLHRRQPDGPYWLSMDAPIDLVPSVGSQMGRRLTGLGVFTVADLIDLDADEVRLRLVSLQITPQRLRDWQAEGVLLCCVPDLTGPDAQLLVVCGIRDAEQLARVDLDQLLRQIGELSDAERIRVGYTSRPSREVVQRWIHSSRRSRSLRDSRRFSRSRGRSASGQRSSSSRGRSSSRSGSRSARPSTSSGSSRSRRTSTRSARRSSTLRSKSRQSHDRDSGQDRDRREQEAIITPFVSAKPQEAKEREEQDWTFYLSPESPVVDAPSIGPTTSKRLEKVGVITVADLLNRNAADVATRLKNRRVKEETVLLWQQQARLMSRIPQLRGHDAQVLVACDITEPEKVAAMSPSALYDVVGPFVATKEGQRLLRSSKTPDLEEVTDWVNWARHSRNLRAA